MALNRNPAAGLVGSTRRAVAVLPAGHVQGIIQGTVEDVFACLAKSQTEAFVGTRAQPEAAHGARGRKSQGISPTSRKIRFPSPVLAMTKLVLSPAVGLNWTELGCRDTRQVSGQHSHEWVRQGFKMSDGLFRDWDRRVACLIQGSS